jgi:Flp pilus assembly protein TadG
MRRNGSDREWGQALVETALVIPIFTLMLVGIVEVGRLSYASIEVSNAARAAVSYAAQNHTTAVDTTNIQNAATQDAREVTSLTATPSHACYCESSGGSLTALASCSSTDTNLTTCASPSHIVLFVTVNTTAPIDTAFHFPGIPSSITLRGQATMRVEQ